MDSNLVRILLVEDDPDDVWLMRHVLGDRWEQPFEMVHVDQLAAALEVCRHRRFDVVLLDLGLPDSRGIDTFLAFQREVRGTPTVVLTGYDDQEEAIRAVQAGAEDYLAKGQVNDRLLARSIRYAIERQRRREAEAQLSRTAEEFRAAREIQQRLYPDRPPQLPGMEVAGALEPAEAAAGDYFDYIPLIDGSLAIVVGDVSGHGIGAALLMSAARACLRTLAHVHADVGAMLNSLNQLLIGDANDFHFVTLILVRIDPVRRKLTYASGGQPGFLIQPDGAAALLESANIPLGVRSDEVYQVIGPISLREGQIVALFTDGLFEAEPPGRSPFGMEHVVRLIAERRALSAADIVGGLRGELRRFVGDQARADDVTLVICKVLPAE